MNRKHWLPLLSLLLLAALLRLYRLSEQSLWLDEFVFVGLLPAKSLGSHFLWARTIGPELCVSPLYFLAQYLWAHGVGLSIPLLRLLPLCLSLLGIPIAYALGLRIGGRFVALTAALLLALSPQHIWYAQELRPYGALGVLALLSFYALLRACRDNQARWWVFNALVNALLLWTYALGGLVFIIEGLFLLLFSGRSWKSVIAWNAVQVCIILPWLWWALQTPFVHAFHGPAYPSLVFREMASALFFETLVSGNQELLPPWKSAAWNAAPPALSLLLAWRPYIDGALVTALLAGAAYGLGMAAGLFPLRRRTGEQQPREAYSLESVGLLVLAAAVPVLSVGAMRMALHIPIYVASKYFLYGPVCLFILLALALRALPSARVRGLLLAALALFYACQDALLLPEVTRCNYREAAAHIHREGNADDAIMCFQWLAPENTFSHYVNPDFQPVQRVAALHGACEIAYESFRALPEQERPHHRVWLAMPMYAFQQADVEARALDALVSGLAERGLVSIRTVFPGHWNMNLFEIVPAEAALPDPPFATVPTPFPFDEDRLMHDLKLSYADETQRQTDLHALRKALFSWPPMGSVTPLMDSFELIAIGESPLGLAMAKYCLCGKEDWGMAHFAAGLAYIGQDDDQQAERHFQLAFDNHPGLHALVGSFTEALLRRDRQCACKAMESIQAQGAIYFAPAMERVLASRFPETTECVSQRRRPCCPATLL